MMRRQFTDDRLPKSSFKAPLWLGAILILAAALGLYAYFKGKGAAMGAARPDSGSAQRPYANRSVSQKLWGARGAPNQSPVITGIVYDAEGHPLRDAAVTASTFEVAGNVSSPAGTIKSDELGRFELPLQEGTYQLSASLEGHGPAGATAHTGDTIALVLPESGVIAGRVMDERGDPVSRFVIDVIVSMPGDMPAPPPVFSRRFTSLDGSFRIDQIPGWDVVVRAGAEGYAPAYSQDLSVPPGVTVTADLKLARGCVLTGRVEDASGAPASRVLVDAESQLGAGAVGELSVQTSDQAESGNDGSFSLQNVPKGKVTVRAYGGDSAVTTALIEVADCAQLKPLKLVTSAGASLSGVARDRDGTPIAGARLTLMQRTMGFVSTASDAEGRFRFEKLPPGLARFELSYQARSIQRFAKLETGRESKMDMVLPAAGTGQLRGRVTAGGKPLAGAQLMIASNLGHGKGLGVFRPVTGSDGSYRLDQIPEGPYAVSVVSTPVIAGAQVKPGQTATVDLDVTAQLIAMKTKEQE